MTVSPGVRRGPHSPFPPVARKGSAPGCPSLIGGRGIFSCPRNIHSATVTRLHLSMKTLLALFFLASISFAEEYMCKPPPEAIPQECTCRIVVRGKGITTVRFRKGEIVSTEAGWLPDPERGWRKIDKDKALPQAGKMPFIGPVILPVSRSPVPNVFCLIGLEATTW